MSWPAVFLVFFLSHLAGDFLLQTNWQASNKRLGLGGDRVARRALVTHSLCYTLAFVPALVWLGGDLGAVVLLAVAAGIGVPHLVQDDGRLVARWMRRVKHCEIEQFPFVGLAVDQTLHLLALFGLALLATS
jgi:Flp pilus assembly protein TadB